MRVLVLAASLAMLAGTPALAQSGDEAVAGALACQAVRGTKARLRCFEDAMPALKEAHPGAVALAAERAEAARLAAAESAKEEFGLSPAQQEETKTASAGQYERDAFGESDLKDDDDDEVEEVEGKALEIGKNNRGKIFVILDNGQVWRQIAGDSASPYYPKNVDGLPVTIKKGTFGSYFVKIGNAKAAFKAERIK
jgi:nucleoid-associated protein YgaU